MKIPSIIRIPKHQKFHVEPRYYDPIKEEISQRTSRIKKEIEQETKDTSNDHEISSHARKIYGAFSGRIAKRERDNTGLFQFLLMIVLFVSFFGYLQFGNVALYMLGLILLVFSYLKFRRIL